MNIATIKCTAALLLAGTILAGAASPLMAQDVVPPPLPSAPAEPVTTPAPATIAGPAATSAPAAPIVAAPTAGVIRSITVRGSERLEPETVRAYANLRPGDSYTTSSLDAALKDLYATELFQDVQIEGGQTGDLVIAVRENPVINRIVLEGNKRLKSDKITPEIKLAPRQIYTRSKVRADVDRIIELYRRQGRFAARVEPKIVQLDQNRVDLVFEIYEGDLSKVRKINIIGNDAFGDGQLRKQMYTHQSGGVLGFLKSNDSYDPDRLAADQQKLRAFYLTQGYADFRVVSALAELTPDRKDFIITYVVEEGPRYRLGKVDVQSALRDLPADKIKQVVNLKSGGWFNAKAVEDSVTSLNEAAGNLGYAFADIDPAYNRDADKHIMNITFKVGDTPRVYVERIDINGNTTTRDKVVRREFRLNEGDAFDAIKLKRSQDRIQSLGYFQDKLEIKQTEGSAPDRVVLGVDVEEKSTGQLQLSGGYSSLEQFVIQAQISQNNFMGKGQELDAGVNYSRYAKSAQVGFIEPYLFDKPILLGVELHRSDYNSFNFIGTKRNTTYSQLATGGSVRTGFPISEFLSFGLRYSLTNDKVSLDRTTFYTNGACDPLKAGRYLCDEIGTRLTSLIGYSAVFDNTNGIRATRGQRMSLSQDFAGAGGDVRYIRTRADATKYWGFGGFIFSTHAEGGYIKALQSSIGPGRDPIRLTDRFFGPELRGFDIRGIGPRIKRFPYNIDGTLGTATKNQISDALGGKAYYMGRLELELPVSASIRSLGLRPSAFVDAGSLWNLTTPELTNVIASCLPVTANTTGKPFNLVPGGAQTSCGPTDGTAGFTRVAGFQEQFLGNSPKPRLSIGIGVNWISPFGPLRIDLAKALLKQKGDETKLFSFNVGTQF